MNFLPDWLTGYDPENAARAAEADARLRQINLERALVYGPDWQTAVDRNFETQEPFDEASQRDAINQAFGEGLKEGRGNITDAIKGAFDFVGKTLASVLLGVPVWAWLLAAGAVWVYLGAPGLRQLKGKIAK